MAKRRTDYTVAKRRRTDYTIDKRRRTDYTVAKRTNNNLHKTTQKTSDWATRTPTKKWE